MLVNINNIIRSIYNKIIKFIVKIKKRENMLNKYKIYTFDDEISILINE